MGRSGAEWEFEARAPKGDAPRSGPGTSVSPLTFATVPDLFFILETKTVMGDPPRVGRAKMLRPGPEPGSQEASARVRGDRPRLGFLEACALSPQGVIGATVWWRRKRGGKEPSGPSAWARGAAAGPGQSPAAHDAPRGGSPPGPARRASPGAHSSRSLPASHTDARGCPVPARSPSAVSVTRGPKPVSGKLQKQTIHRFSVTCF